MIIAILLPAAGASSRMRGTDKLLQPVGGVPCLRVMAERALRASARVIVTLPASDHPRARALAGLDLHLVPVADAHLGMGHSLKAGAAAVPPDADGLMVVPADMPDITAEDLAALIEAFGRTRPQILRATAEDGTPGHPILFHRDLLPGFRHLSGDRGAIAIVRSARDVCLHSLPGQRALLDLDTPEAWAAWRGAPSEPGDG